ncbi:hypothetical protein MBANPS3_007781 [Mucor bainieri]
MEESTSLVQLDAIEASTNLSSSDEDKAPFKQLYDEYEVSPNVSNALDVVKAAMVTPLIESGQAKLTKHRVSTPLPIKLSIQKNINAPGAEYHTMPVDATLDEACLTTNPVNLNAAKALISSSAATYIEAVISHHNIWLFHRQMSSSGTIMAWGHMILIPRRPHTLLLPLPLWCKSLRRASDEVNPFLGPSILVCQKAPPFHTKGGAYSKVMPVCGPALERAASMITRCVANNVFDVADKTALMNIIPETAGWYDICLVASPRQQRRLPNSTAPIVQRQAHRGH